MLAMCVGSYPVAYVGSAQALEDLLGVRVVAKPQVTAHHMLQQADRGRVNQHLRLSLALRSS